MGAKTKRKYRESKKSEKKEGILSVSKTGLTTLVFIVVIAWLQDLLQIFYNLDFTVDCCFVIIPRIKSHILVTVS